MRTSDNHYKDGKLYNGYDYERQVWILKGIYQRCGHPENMTCQCYGKLHAGKAAE